jgi:hypothetical protein
MVDMEFDFNASPKFARKPCTPIQMRTISTQTDSIATQPPTIFSYILQHSPLRHSSQTEIVAAVITGLLATLLVNTLHPMINESTTNGIASTHATEGSHHMCQEISCEALRCAYASLESICKPTY